MTDRNSTSSITEKVTGCMSCGTPVVYRTNSRVYCAPCRKEVRREKDRLAAERKRRASGIKPVKGTTTKCQDCGKEFERADSKSIRCKPCQSEYVLEKARERSKLRKTDPRLREQYNDWYRKSLNESPRKRIGNHFRVMMHRALGKKKEGRSWREFVDYSLEELMQHLERQLLPGMTWGNQGEWHIDHIIPQSSFRFSSPDDPEFKACWALSNLRPMWAKENIQKNARRMYLL